MYESSWFPATFFPGRCPKTRWRQISRQVGAYFFRKSMEVSMGKSSEGMGKTGNIQEVSVHLSSGMVDYRGQRCKVWGFHRFHHQTDEIN